MRAHVSRVLIAGATAGIVAVGVPGWAAAAPVPDTITTVAGGVGGPDPASSVSVAPCGVRYSGGYLYVGTGDAVRRIDPVTDSLVNVAGNGATGPAAGTATAVTSPVSQACNLARDSYGNILFPSGGSIEAVAGRTGRFYGTAMTAGRLYTIASGFQGDVVDVEPGVSGTLLATVDGFVENHGTPPGGAQVWAVAESTGTFYGIAMRAGQDYVIAGTITQSDVPDNGEIATQAWLSAYIGTLRVDQSGNIVLMDSGVQPGTTIGGLGPLVRVIAEKNGTFYGLKMRTGLIYDIAGDWELPGDSGNGVLATNARLYNGNALTLDAAGNIVIADWGQVRVVAVRAGTFYGKTMKAGYIYTIAGNGVPNHSGDGGPATSAELTPVGVAYDPADGVTLIPDLSGGSALPSATVRAVASRSGTFFGLAMKAGDIYTIAGGRVSGPRSDVPALDAGTYLNPGIGMAATAAGNVVIPQSGFNIVQVLASRSGTFFGLAMKAGYIYTIAGDGTAGYSGDNGPALKAQLVDPAAAAIDGAGNILLVDGPRVRVIAAVSGTFYGQAMKAGDIYTIAGDGSYIYSGDGGPATAAGMAPVEVTVDGLGNVLISDLSSGRIRVLAARSCTCYGVAMTAGDIYTIAGTLNPNEDFGDGGPATSAFLNILGLALTPAGDILFADELNYRIRSISG